MSEKISIVFICDDKFVLPTLVAITSLLINRNKRNIYEINIIEVECNERNIELLKSLQDKNFKINIIHETNHYRDLGLEHAHVSKAALIKFDLANIFPYKDKILYLDGDITIHGDLADLYNTDIENYYGAMIKDMKVILINKEKDNYFNSGVMLLNLKKLRSENIPNKLVEAKSSDINRYQDQDVFNNILSSNVLFLSGKYNYLNRFEHFFTKNEISKFYNERNIKPVILHYASQYKPWEYIWNQKHCKVWYKYFKKSKLKNIALNRQKIHITTKEINYYSKFIRHIFSVTNDNHFHKVFCILGVKFKLKNKYKMLENKIDKNTEKEVEQIRKIEQRNNFIYKHGINKEKMLYNIEKFSEFGITKDKRSQKIIVSLTSYPERFYDLHYTLYSLFKQTLKPDEIILYLTSSQCPNKEQDIGNNILKFKNLGLKIRYYDNNIKSHTKLIPALKDYPDDIIITVDDDIYYEETMLENLYNSYLGSDKTNIVANRCHRIKYAYNQIQPYCEWDKCIIEESCLYSNFLTGVGGVLYPPHSLHKDIFNEDLFMKLSPDADDIWFWAMALLNGTKIMLSKSPIVGLKYVNPQREMCLNDDGTLYSSNGNGGNDKQLAMIVSQYPQIADIIKQEQQCYCPN